MTAINFQAVSYPCRLYSGKDALENLPAVTKRQRAHRAFIVCGRTVSRKTGLIARIRRILGESCAGVFDEVEKDTTLPSVLKATAAARAANADLIIGVGGGSVIQATRVVAILLAERQPIDGLITQYPEHGPAVSPKLAAPKIPIINVLTLPTTAQNRAGSAVRDEKRDHRMEFFDPKTRPVAVFWDADALLTAPPTLTRSASCSVFWRAVLNLAATDVNPLVEGDRLQAFGLARRALPLVMNPADAAPRIELCAASFLQNRDADDGGSIVNRNWVMRVTYAFATALFICFPHVGQGEANTALMGTALRELGSRDPEAMARMAEALGVWDRSMPLADAPRRAADWLDEFFAGLGMPVRVRDLNVPRDGLGKVIENSLKNFNADPQREFVRERERLHEILDRAW